MTVSRKAPRTSLGELALLQREVSQLFERLAEYEQAERSAAGEWVPSVDVYECRGRLVVVVEVPGLAPESVKIVGRDHELVVSGERRERRSAAAGTFLCVERPQGRFVRRIPVDLALDIREAEARLAGGLLTIVIPRLKDRRGRETVIPVRRDEEP